MRYIISFLLIFCCLLYQEWTSTPKPSKATPNTSNDSKSEDEFLTASECTCTPPSRSSSFQTASEGGPASPWWDIEPTSDPDEKAKAEGIRIEKVNTEWGC